MFNKFNNRPSLTLLLVIIVAISFLVPVEDDDTGTSTQYSGSSSMVSTPHAIRMVTENAEQRKAIESALNSTRAAHSAYYSDTLRIHRMSVPSPSALKYPNLTEKEREILTARRSWMSRNAVPKVDSKQEIEPQTGEIQEATSTPKADAPEVAPRADVPEDAPEM